MAPYERQYQIRLNTYIMFGGGEGGELVRVGLRGGREIEGEKVWIEL
ncbi:MAG: hypothetical protein SWX82_03215 [Cyanobacteriota bacterium]|nr:hypothetical protein [Cyanobacteriota bacterium]